MQLRGRTRNCLLNIRAAARAGRRHGARGLLVTDWGDFGHRQNLPASYCGLLYAAAVSWCGRTNENIDVGDELGRHVFGDPTGAAGRLWLDAGRLDETSGVALVNRTVLFECMNGAFGEDRAIEGLSIDAAARVIRRILALQSAAANVRFGCDDAEIVRAELEATLAVLLHAARRAACMATRRHGRRARYDRRALSREIKQVMRRHRACWLARNRSGGLAESMDHYRRNLGEYET